MDQREIYFTRLHRDLGQKCNIDPQIVRYLRNCVLGMQWSKEQIIQHLSQRISKKTGTQTGYGIAIHREQARKNNGKRYNGSNMRDSQFALDNLNRNLNFDHQLLDTVLRLTPDIWNSLLEKSEMDK